MSRALLAALALATAASPLAAQSIRSPYRDIVHGRSLTVFYGDMAGDGGKVGVGPHNGRVYGVRGDIRLGAPLQFGLTLSHAETERLVVSADDSVANRVDGPVAEPITMVEAAMQLNVTGKKSWHGLAPFVGVGVGLAIGGDGPGTAVDSSGYKFGTKFFFSPGLGARFFLGQSFSLRVEARQLFWKLKYPLVYTEEPAAEPSSDPDRPNAVLPDGKRDAWSGARELRVGAAFHF